MKVSLDPVLVSELLSPQRGEDLHVLPLPTADHRVLVLNQ